MKTAYIPEVTFSVIFHMIIAALMVAGLMSWLAIPADAASKRHRCPYTGKSIFWPHGCENEFKAPVTKAAAPSRPDKPHYSHDKGKHKGKGHGKGHDKD